MVPVLLHCTGAANSLLPHYHTVGGAPPDIYAPQDETNHDLKNGKSAHLLAAADLRNYTGEKAPPPEIPDDPDREDAENAARLYAGAVKATYRQLQAQGKDPKLLVEHRVDCLEVFGHPNTCVGFCDSVIVTEDTLHIYEFKAGWGNLDRDALVQARAYGLGLLEQYQAPAKIYLKVLKPLRITEFCEELTPDELIDWGKATLVPLADRILHGDRTFVPGPHCFFCPMQPHCRPWIKWALYPVKTCAAVLEGTAGGATVVDNTDLPRLLDLFQAVDQYRKPIEAGVIRSIHNHKSIPGYHLERKLGPPRFADVAEAERILRDHGYAKEARKPATPNQVKDAIGAAQFQRLLSGLVTRTPGREKLVKDKSGEAAYQ